MTNQQRQTSLLLLKHMPMQWLIRLATLSMVIILQAGCVALLWQVQQGSSASRAFPAIPTDVGVVGPPSLSAATVNAIFAQIGSPMAGTGTTVETLSRQYRIDDAFALSVWYTETNDGEAGVGSADRNPGSVRGSPGYPSAWDGYTIYPSYTAAIINWFSILNGRYISSGLTTVYSIARPYVGTSSYPLWAGKVINLIYHYRGIAPPPPANTPTPAPTAKPTPKPTPIPTLSPAMVVQKHRQATLLPHDSDSSYVRTNQGLSNETYRTAPAQIAAPAVPTASTQSSSLSPTLLYLIMFFGLLAALLLALFARRIGRDIPLKTATSTNWPNAASQSMAILSPVDTEAELVLVGSVSSASSAAWNSNRIARNYVPLLDLTPMPPISQQDASRWLPVAETTTEALNSLPTTPSRQFLTPSMCPMHPMHPMHPMRPMDLPARSHQTDALPPNSDPRIPVTANAGTERPGGLLSRYRDEHHL